MAQITRVQEMEGVHRRGVSNSHSSGTTTFLGDSLKQSIDLPAYISWQTLSTEVSHRLRQGSMRINKSNELEFTSIEDGDKTEKSPLLEQFASRKSPYSTRGIPPVRYPDINSNESVQSNESISATNIFGPLASSWKVGVFLLCNTALGAGILNYPAAYDRLGGIVIATILQAIVLVLMASTMLVLIFCADLHFDTTYHDVLRSMCGKRAQQLAAASIMATCFGINVTFLVIIGDQFDRLFSTFIGPNFCDTLWFNRDFSILVTACLFIWPICYFKRLDFLSYVSTLGIFAILYVVFLNIYEYYYLDVIPGVIKTEPSSPLEVAASLPVILFAYQSHEIVLPIYSSLEKPRTANFLKSTAVSLTVLFAIYALGGTYGYLTFGSKVIADIIQMYDAKDPVVTAGVIALIIKMVTTYPPMMFCGRGALDGLYAEWRQLSAEAFIRGEKWRRITITTLWNISVLLLAIVTPNITIAIELLGSLAACNVFVFPGMCMLSLARRHLNGYYAKFKNDRRLLRTLEGTLHWTLIWKSLILYGSFIILFGCFFFGIVFVQVGNDIWTRLSTNQTTETAVCGVHSAFV